MRDIPTKAVILVGDDETQQLTPAQKKYNAALAKIDKQKALLAQWQATHETCQQQIAGKLRPLQQVMVQEQLQLLFLLDDYLTGHKFTKKEKRQLTELIEFLCDQLMDDSDDPQFLVLLERYFPNLEEEREAEKVAMAEMDAQMRAEFSKAFGFELDESVDLDDPAEIARFIFDQQEQAREAEMQQKPRKKTAKQLAKEAKVRAEEEAAQQSIQSIYRQLVKTLHPDRESDPTERERKTQLMQEITTAYEAKNLIRLLEFQLAETQMSHQLHQLSDEKINSFIKLLSEQLEQLKTETSFIQDRYRMLLGMAPFESLSIRQLQSFLKQDIKNLEQKIERVRADRMLFSGDIGYLKTWLKYQP